MATKHSEIQGTILTRAVEWVEITVKSDPTSDFQCSLVLRRQFSQGGQPELALDGFHRW
jgi:hypothetical protein